MYLVLAMVCLLSPVLAIPLAIGQFCHTRRIVPNALLVALGMGVLAMGLVNSAGGDLTTYAEEANSYARFSFAETLSMKYGNYPVAAFVFWVSGHLGNPRLFQLVNGSIEYGVMFYIIFDYAKKNDFSNRQIITATVLTLAIVPFFNSVSAIRTTPAFFIGMLALYRDVYQGRRGALTIALYIAPGLIHSAGWSVLGIRLVASVLQKSRLLCFAAGAAIIPVLLLVAYAIEPLFTWAGIDAVGKLVEYSQQSASGWAATVSASTFYRLYRLFNICFILCCALSFLVGKAPSKRKDRLLLNCTLVALGLVLGFCLFMEDPAFMRYSYTFYPLVVLMACKTRLRSSGRSVWFVVFVSSAVFFVSQAYLLSIGANMLSFLSTLLLGIFGSPWLLGA